MKIIITVCGAILCANLLPVESLYVYGDNPNTGFVSLNNVANSFPIGYNSKQRRFKSLPMGQSYAVNDLVKPKITPPVEPSRDNRNKNTVSQNPTEAPNKQQKKEDINYAHESRSYKSLRGNSQNPNFKPAPMANNRGVEYSPQTKQYDQNYKGNGMVYDAKGNIVQVNIQKTQIPAEPQKIKLNSNRQLTALAVPRREDSYKKMHTLMLVDKSLQKSSNFKERNAQIMSRVLDEMTKKVTDRRIKNTESRKRDTDSTYENSGKHNVVSENIKKYIGMDRNKGKSHQETRPTARIGSREEEIEDTNAPYAVFYRMNPESVDNQEGFIVMKTMDEEDIAFSNKEKRLSVNLQNEVDLKKPKNKKNINPVKLRKKVKNLPSFKGNNV